MRILIVDDNAALQEVLTEVLTNTDNIVESVSSAEAAYSSIAQSRHEVIVLDLDMQEGQGLTFLDKIQNTEPQIKIPIVVIKSRNRQIPQDISMVKSHVEKPFSSSDIIDSINKALAAMADVNNPPQTISKKVTAAVLDEDTLAERGVSFGKSYVLFHNNTITINNLISLFDRDGCDVLVVTARKRKAIMERFRSKKVKALTMTIKMLGGHFNIYGLGSMINEVNDFIKNGNRPVVAFDNLNEIINRNGMNSALTAVHQLVTKEYDKNVSFLVCVDPANFTAKDKGILLKQMIEYDKIGE